MSNQQPNFYIKEGSTTIQKEENKMNKMKLQRIVSIEVLENSEEKYITRVKGAGIQNGPPQSISDSVECIVTMTIFKNENKLVVDSMTYQDILGANVYEFNKDTVYNKNTNQFLDCKKAFVNCLEALADIIDSTVRRCIDDKIVVDDFYWDTTNYFGFVTPLE